MSDLHWNQMPAGLEPGSGWYYENILNGMLDHWLTPKGRVQYANIISGERGDGGCLVVVFVVHHHKGWRERMAMGGTPARLTT